MDSIDQDVKMDIELSIIIPLYNEEENILNLYNELKLILSSLNISYEIIFIDDGSKDGTFMMLKKLRESDNKIKIIKFRMNFGKSTALNVAFKYALGNNIITMDGDGQDDPKEIPRFIRELNQGFDLVSGWKYRRNDPLTKRLPSKIFNTLSSFLTGVGIHDFNCGFKAYKRDFIRYVHLYGELHRYIPALAQWHGFTISEIKVSHRPRIHGKSKYGFTRLFKGFLDLITIKFLMGYSYRPLHIFGLPGIISLSFGFVIGIYLTIIHFNGAIIGERPLLLLSILLILIGLQFLSIGLLGEMMAAQLAKQDDINIYIKDVI